MAVQIMDAPPRKGNLSEKVPALDEIVAALSQTKAGDGKVVGITDPQDKPGTARNIARHAIDMLAKMDPPVVAKAHLVKQGEQYVGAISYKVAKPAGKADTADNAAQTTGKGAK